MKILFFVVAGYTGTYNLVYLLSRRPTSGQIYKVGRPCLVSNTAKKQKGAGGMDLHSVNFPGFNAGATN